MDHRWLLWARRMQSIAQAGLTYARDPFDVERYEALRALALEVVEAHVDVDAPGERARLRDLFASGAGYPTPKVDVRAVVVERGRVLLVRERADGRWALPGGWADPGSTPAEMAVRETAEETGYAVRATRLLALWDEDRHHARPSPVATYKVCIGCELVGGRAAAGAEALDVGWWDPHAPPPLSERRTSRAQLRELVRRHADPALPAALD